LLYNITIIGAILDKEGAGGLNIMLDAKLSSIYAYGASDFAYQATRMNDLVMWRAMIDSIEHGKKDFNFNCDLPDNENILCLKKWGVQFHLKACRSLKYRRFFSLLFLLINVKITSWIIVPQLNA